MNTHPNKLEAEKGTCYFLSDAKNRKIIAKMSNQSVNPINELRPRCDFLQSITFSDSITGGKTASWQRSAKRIF